MNQFQNFWERIGNEEPAQNSNSLSQIHLKGGGGGNRTHVRRNLSKDLYMFSPSLILAAREGDEHTTDWPAWKFSPAKVRPIRRPVSDYDTRPLILTRKEGEQAA